MRLRPARHVFKRKSVTLIKFYRYENRQCQNKIKMPQNKIDYRYRKKE